MVIGDDAVGHELHQVLTELQTGLRFGREQVGLEFRVQERAAEGPEEAGEAVGGLGFVALGLQGVGVFAILGQRGAVGIHHLLPGGRGFVETGGFQHAAVVEHQTRVVIEGQAVVHAVPRAEGIEDEREEIGHVQFGIGQFGIVDEGFGRHDPAVFGEVAHPDQVDQRDVEIAASGEIADLFAQRVFIGHHGVVDLDACRGLEIREHLDRGVVAGAIQEQHLEFGSGIGFGGFFQRPGLRLATDGECGRGKRQRTDVHLEFHGFLPAVERFERLTSICNA